MQFYGRQKEIGYLRDMQKKVLEDCSRFSFVAGRRGSGKTRLIKTAIPDSSEMPVLYWNFKENLSEAENVLSFALDASQKLSLRASRFGSSFEEALERIFQEARRRPLCLVLDDFQAVKRSWPWMQGTLQRLWDLNQDETKLLLIASGSAPSVMEEIFNGPKSPLFARASLGLRLNAFSPSLVKEIFLRFKPDAEGEDVLAFYALTGGLPKYVELLLEKGCFDFDRMARFIAENREAFFEPILSELEEELGESTGFYFSLMAKTAEGQNKREKLLELFGPKASEALEQLETQPGLIRRVPFICSQPRKDPVEYEIRDTLLNFWLPLLGEGRGTEMKPSAEFLTALKDSFFERRKLLLKRLYRRHFVGTGEFSRVGEYFDPNGRSQIDLIGVNDIRKEILLADIRVEPEEFSLSRLEQKAENLFSANPAFREYERKTMCLSLEELAWRGKLP